MITIIDYNSGNIASVCNALKKLDISYKISSNLREIVDAEKIIFPGVGNAKQAMKELGKRELTDAIKFFKKPFLGICLGMQLLFDFSQEGNTKCLGIIKGEVKRFPNTVKIPHIGWNKIRFKISDLRFQIVNKSYFYFVHSYYCEPADTKLVIGETEYEINFCSAVKKNNFYGVQFHPEKSGEKGLELLNNFYRLC